jgi:Domain of unknown function (DUF4105)
MLIVLSFIAFIYSQMKRFLPALFLLLSFSSFSQGIMLSEKAQISVITLGPDPNELYAAFGHSAIRVYDSLQGIDYAYNYGVFDFNQPNFYLNFAKGFLYYKLGVYSYPDFRDAYIYYNRSIHEQVLNLTVEQKQKIFDYVQWNALPENQTYRYDYFYNNCATKVRDVFAEVLGNDIQFDGSFIKTNYTIRELTDLYLSPLPWGDLGIDICLGLPMDKRASPYEYMFLPDYIESSFINCGIRDKDLLIPIVKDRISVFEARPLEIKTIFFHPWIVFGTLLLFSTILTYRDWKRKRLTKWFDSILFLVAGLVGLLLLLLWVATDHKAAANNFNLLWASPIHLIVAFLLLIKRVAKWLPHYFKVTGIVLAATLVLWSLIPQQLNVFLIPIVVALMIRSFLISKLLSEKPIIL